LRGRELRLKAYARIEQGLPRGTGHLWLRVDRGNMQVGFFDNMSDRPITSPEWKKYTIQGKVVEDAMIIVFGCFLMGDGHFMVDAFELAVKNENDEWIPIEVKNPGFEESDNEGPLHWFYQSPYNAGHSILLSEENPFEESRSLSIQKKESYFTGTLFEAVPEAGESIIREISPGLFCRVPLALLADEERTLGGGDADTLLKLQVFLKEQIPGVLSCDNPDVRLADVIIAWNIFQHFYPYFDEVEVDWDRALTQYLDEALKDRDEKDFLDTLGHLVARLQDGHGNVSHNLQRKLARPPFSVEWVEGKVVVTGVVGDLFQKGDIILSVDGVDAEEVLTASKEYISGSSQWKRFKALGQFGNGPEGSTAELKIRRGGKTLEIGVERTHRGQIPEFDRMPIERLDDGVFYVDLSRADWPSIQTRISDIAEARGVVFDLRGYPKGNHQLIAHLLTQPDKSNAWMRVARIIYPDREKIVGYTNHGWLIQPAEPHIPGKVAFITDGRAISYAESFMSFIEHYKLAEIVGQPTAGANGNVIPFNLPGGYRVTFTGMKVVKHDGSQHHTVGILPTVPARRTLDGIRENRDELLEKALELVRGE
jgi:hypothetical protein